MLFLCIRGGDITAFLGYFLKIGSNFTLQKKHYTNESIKMGRKIIVDDSYIDANDVTHEYTSEHTPMVISWTTPYMRVSTAREITDACKERDNLSVTYYDWESDTYKTGAFKATLGDFVPKKTDDTGIIMIAPTTIKLEEY